MIPMDLVLHNGRIADVFRLRQFEGWVGIRNGRFVYVEERTPPTDIQATQMIDLEGRMLAPGLIDAHMHIESSLITPRRFAEAVLPFGTTAILSDPHEVANVAGLEGVRWMIAASHELTLRIYHAIPSCVPATSQEIEWTAEVFDAGIVDALRNDPSVIALGEVMDYRGLLGDNPRLQAIVAAAHEARLLIEGHIPTLIGRELSEYLAHGVGSDHTLTFQAKIEEQISKGLAVMLQTKSITPENIRVVADLPDKSRILLITDDIEPPLLVHGHLSRMVSLAIEAGMPPMEALAAVTIRPARYLNLRDLGGIAPGFCADFMILDNLTEFPPQQVFVNGRAVADSGQCLITDLPNLPALNMQTTIPGPLAEDAFRLVPSRKDVLDHVQANVISIQNKTNTLTKLERITIRVKDGFSVFADDDNLALAAIFARDGSSHAVGVIKNTGLIHGAFASSLCHDSHNLLVVGRDATSMSRAAGEVHKMRGGVAVAHDDNIRARLALPFFGLLSDEAVAGVGDQLTAVEDALRSLGMDHQRPFLLLSIMGLSVSPYYKFTDKGIVDTEKRTLIRCVDVPGET